MTDIEIGMNVVAKLYLHILDNEFPTPFEAHKIDKLENSDFGTIVFYKEMADVSSDIKPVTYIVSETIEEINEALHDAKKFRDAGLNAIRSMLNEG